MDSGSSTSEQTFLKEVRRRRAELRESMDALERALAAPGKAGENNWSERVNVALVELSADLREHIELTEGPEGVYQELLSRAPRLSGPVQRLVHEHGQLSELIDDLLGLTEAPGENQEIFRVRELGTTLLGSLVRHRQRGSDLIYEAYDVDIGGET